MIDDNISPSISDKITVGWLCFLFYPLNIVCLFRKKIPVCLLQEISSTTDERSMKLLLRYMGRNRLVTRQNRLPLHRRAKSKRGETRYFH
ncbi:hypothetical protein AQUCO_04200067v1 [Aquilegia coerulea]|uniref:Uncharacterized protein n=1 Tax=Aquilegia coerulea TaxID=218851 RepID=A0A2G5CP30_AQUCA|nr:hypothetical protein AQUCO_04200067v1 [Aquilegia coerulea]